MMTDEEKVKTVEASLDGVEKEFREHCMSIVNTTKYLSFHKSNHPDLIALENMGTPIIPYILRDLEKYRNISNWNGVMLDFDPWYHFMLLHKLTNEWPAEKKDAGRLSPILNAWIRWGEEKGIIKHEEVILGRQQKSSRLYMGCCKIIQGIRSLYRATWSSRRN